MLPSFRGRIPYGMSAMTMTIIRPDSKLLARLLLPLRTLLIANNPSTSENTTPEEKRNPPLFFTNLKCKFHDTRSLLLTVKPTRLNSHREIQSIARKRRIYYAFIFEKNINEGGCEKNEKPRDPKWKISVIFLLLFLSSSSQIPRKIFTLRIWFS